MASQYFLLSELEMRGYRPDNDCGIGRAGSEVPVVQSMRGKRYS